MTSYGTNEAAWISIETAALKLYPYGLKAAANHGTNRFHMHNAKGDSASLTIVDGMVSRFSLNQAINFLTAKEN